MKRALALIAVVSYLQLAAIGNAQDAVPGEILERTVPIRGATEQGTAFSIDYGGTIYEITARHVMVGVAEQHPTNVQVRKGAEWLTLPVKRILYPSSADVDIAVLETTYSATKPFSVVQVATGTIGMTMGQNVWFLGYPFIEGLGSKFVNGVTAPFIKRGTISAVDASKPNAIVLYIDGFNNQGFSGGPIVFWDFTSHRYFISGVVIGYKNDTAKALVNGQQVDTNLLVNSGILVGYSIDQAISAIKDAPPEK